MLFQRKVIGSRTIESWFNSGKIDGSAYMVVSYNTGTKEVYPHYVKRVDGLLDLLVKLTEEDNDTTIDGVYDLSLSWENNLVTNPALLSIN